LKTISADLKKNAAILLYAVQSKLYGSVDTSKLQHGATADDITKVLDTEGYQGAVTGPLLASSKKASSDPVNILHQNAYNLFQRTAT
jgi:predicted double-glycine peptidase